MKVKTGTVYDVLRTAFHHEDFVNQSMKASSRAGIRRNVEEHLTCRGRKVLYQKL